MTRHAIGGTKGKYAQQSFASVMTICLNLFLCMSSHLSIQQNQGHQASCQDDQRYDQAALLPDLLLYTSFHSSDHLNVSHLCIRASSPVLRFVPRLVDEEVHQLCLYLQYELGRSSYGSRGRSSEIRRQRKLKIEGGLT